MFDLDHNWFPQLPARSPFHPQPALGVGCPLAESLTGYFSRLAETHALTVADLLDHELFAGCVLTSADRRLKRRIFQASCYLLSGSESHTPRWIDALESATCQSDLRHLTLLSYAKLCDGSWLRRKRAWCPQCYEQWRVNKHIIYEPLLWSISVVSLCPLHRISLVDTCPHCHKTHTPLAGRTCPGYCGHCLGWLGASTEMSATDSGTADPEGYRYWCSEQIGFLVAASPQIQVPFERETIQRALSGYIEMLAPVSFSALAEATNCSRRSIAMWMQGTTLPRIESLCRLCFYLHTSILDLLRGIELKASTSSARNHSSRGGVAEVARHDDPAQRPPNAGGRLHL
jgi:transcriptional regulator with XRE-family HTH domain